MALGSAQPGVDLVLGMIPLWGRGVVKRPGHEARPHDKLTNKQCYMSTAPYAFLVVEVSSQDYSVSFDD